jgi:hypothetical protein
MSVKKKCRCGKTYYVQEGYEFISQCPNCRFEATRLLDLGQLSVFRSLNLPSPYAESPEEIAERKKPKKKSAEEERELIEDLKRLHKEHSCPVCDSPLYYGGGCVNESCENYNKYAHGSYFG